MKKHYPRSDEDPQMNPPSPCGDIERNPETHPKTAVEGGPIFPTDMPKPKDIPPNIPLK